MLTPHAISCFAICNSKNAKHEVRGGGGVEQTSFILVTVVKAWGQLRCRHSVN